MGRPQMWCKPGQTISLGGGIKEIVAARCWDNHTLPEGLALYTRALCAMRHIHYISEE